MNATVEVHVAALDGLAGIRTRHMFFDAEPQDGRWTVVLRGEDKTKVGAKCPANLHWNNTEGDAIPIALATVTGPDAEPRARALAQALIAFYGAEGEPFSQRVAGLDAEGKSLALLLATVGQSGANPHANKAARWRVGSIQTTREAKRLAREKADKASAVASIAASASNPAMLEHVAASVRSPEELAALEAIVARARKRVAIPA